MHLDVPDPPRDARAAGTARPDPAWPPQALARIEQELARCVGPVAGMLVRRAAPRHATPQALVLALAPSIEGAADRAAFVRACSAQTAPRREAPASASAPRQSTRRSTRPPSPAAPPSATPRQAAATPAARVDPTPAAAPVPTAPPSPRPAERRDRSAVRARTLSPHWRGVATRGHRDLALLPLWAAAAFAGLLLLASWLALNARLDARARPLFARIAAVPAALNEGDGAPAGRPRLAALLAADVAAASVEVRDEARRSLLVLPAQALFADGQTRLDARADGVLERVAQALRQARGGGELLVIGHGAAAAPSLQHPSNWHFTRARAQAVADALAARGVAPARAEGRAEFEPRADAAPGSRSDRIEIELRLPRPDEAPTP